MKLRKKKCPVCGETFTPVRKAQKFCSRKCQVWSNSHREQTCTVCGGKFIGAHTRKYCSKECKSIGISEAKRKNLLTMPSEKKHSKKVSLVEKEAIAREQGLGYADLQKTETAAMFARVEVGR